MADVDMSAPPDDDWAREICKIGKGTACCRYLTMGPMGWDCEKHTDMKAVIDGRANEMTARSDNCAGRGVHKPAVPVPGYHVVEQRRPVEPVKVKPAQPARIKRFKRSPK